MQTKDLQLEKMIWAVRCFYLCLLFTILCLQNAQAAYLRNIPVTKTQPDGTILHCFASGDEYFNYLHDANGYTIIQHPITGYYVYADRRDGKLVATDFVAGKSDPASKGLTPFNLISPEDWMDRRRARERINKPHRDASLNHGTLNNIAIFIRFKDDNEFTNSFSPVDNMFNDESQNAISMINYFKSASYNAITIHTHFYPEPNGETIISYQDIHPICYYEPKNEFNPNGYANATEMDEREFGLLERAVNYVNAFIPSNLNIDHNNDGKVDNVCLIVKADVSGEILWPHKYTLLDRIVTINGKQVYTYNLQLAEADPTLYFNASTMCHEMNHSLGAPDLYHYSYSGPDPVGSWDLMNSNTTPPQHCGAYIKWKYGYWIDEIPEITASGTYTLNPISSSTPENVAYKIATGNPNQYYVLEYRNTNTPFESALPGSGLLIYRIDTRFEGNQDYNPDSIIYDEVYIFRPNGSLLDEGDLNNAHFCSNENRTEFGPLTNPYPFFSEGIADNSFRIYDITSAGNTISFKYESLVQYTITATANPPSGGTVSGSGSYSENSECTLTAIPNPHYTFTNWTKNGVQVSTDPTYTFTVTETASYTANFSALTEHTITCNSVENGTISASASWAYMGETITLYPDPIIGLSGWIVKDASNHSITVTNNQFTMPDSNVTVSAVFTQLQTATIGDLMYYLNDNTLTAEVRGPKYVYSGILTIPSSVTYTNENGQTRTYAVTSIGNSAFNGCSGFTGSLTIPNSVTSIGEDAFYNCSGFTGSLTIPNSVTSIGNWAFRGCSGFTGSLTIPNSVITIGYDAFCNCSGFTGSLTIPNSVTSIGSSAFQGCSGFTGSLTIGNSVTSIGNWAFRGCSGFTGSLTIPNSVTSIGTWAFGDCSGFTGSLTIPNSVTSIGGCAFYNCSGFNGSLIIGNSVTRIDDSTFYGCSGFTGSLTIGNSVTTIDYFAFYNCSGFTGSLTIPNSVTSIGWAAFCGCSGFTGSLTIGNSVTSIDNSAFCNCSGFTGSLTIGNSVTSIGYYAFENCNGFTGSLTIPNSVTSIGWKAFYGCSGFDILTIPDSVTSIHDNAFSDCSGLASMTILANNPAVLGSNVFNNVDKTIPVYVPCASVLTYQNTAGWNEFTNYMPETACDSGEIAVTVNPTEGGTVTGAGYYEGGVTCTVTATANDGYDFMYWEEDGLIISYDNTYSFIVSGDRDLVANFAEEGSMCTIVFDLYDSYGDGWTGNYLVIDYGDGNSEHLTINSGSSAYYSRMVTTGSHITLTWIMGNWPEDCSFTIHYEDGDTIYESSNIGSNFEYSFDVNCSGENTVTQTTALTPGWNWYSTYIEQEGIDGLGQLENSIGVPKAIIQSQGDGYVKSILRNGRILWGGALSSINNEEMYKIGTKYICEATMEGVTTNPAEHPITINKGWNWIGFPCSQSVSVNVAMSGFTPKNNDVIKGIHSYATFSNGTWSGTLNTLEPGQGYMYGSRSNASKTLVYQTGRGEATIANITPENNFFQPTEDYADNMTLTAIVELDGEELRSDDYELAAFVGDKCRGSVKLMYVEPIDRYVAFLTVFGDYEEDLHFRLTDGVATSLSTDRLAYTTDGILGELDNPVVLHFGPMDVEESILADVKVYPNPSEGIFNIEGQNIRKVEVFNAFGQLVYSKDSKNGLMMIDLTNQAAGIYLIRIVTDNGIWSHQLMKR